MSDSAFTELVSSQLRACLLSGDVQLPIKSFDLLRTLIQRQPHLRPASDLSQPRLRLTDLRKVESALDELTDDWEYGRLEVVHDLDGMALVDAQVLAGGASRKRKRDEPEEENTIAVPNALAPALKNGNGLREVYALLQHGSAKRKLVAEQVCLSCSWSHATD